MIWMLVRQPSYRNTPPDPRLKARARRWVGVVVVALGLLFGFSSVASAEIILDGVINESEWHRLGDSAGGPPPSFGPGHEINALYADMNASHFFIGVAGNVQFGNRILVFIDSAPGGYTNGNFGRDWASPGIRTFNHQTTFDNGFTPNYVLSISTNPGQHDYIWELYTLSGSVGHGGGPILYLGNRNDPDLRANPANGDPSRGFEARLTYSVNGLGVDMAINQSEVQLMALYINDSGTVSNQFIGRANGNETHHFGSQPIAFNLASPDPVRFGRMVVINEIDYVQPGPNTAEFIELKNISNIPVNLDSYRLHFARGIYSPPDVYRTDIDLPNFTLYPNAYFVICTNPAFVPNCNLPVPPSVDLLENVIPAAVALVQSHRIVDVVSYGGNTGAPYSEGAGVLPTDDGAQINVSIGRNVDGLDTNRNHIDFGLRCVTPGYHNGAQTGNCGPQTPTVTPTPTPTSTATPRPYYPPTPPYPPTPHYPPTPYPPYPPYPVTPPPSAACRDVMVNGNFESYQGWEFGNDPVPGMYTSNPVRGGARSIQLGIAPESGYAPVYSYSSIRQQVSVPAGASVQLRWWHLYRTELPTLHSTSNAQDRQEVILLTTSGETLHIVQRVRSNEGGWQQSNIDLSAFAGQSFVLYFNVLNYGGARTWGFIDDVELLVCPPQGGSYPPYRDGYGRDEYNRDGYNRDDTYRDGYGRDGYGRDGYGRDGYGRDGYGRDGYDNRYVYPPTPQPGGYPRDGYDPYRPGYGNDGYNRPPNTPPGGYYGPPTPNQPYRGYGTPPNNPYSRPSAPRYQPQRGDNPSPGNEPRSATQLYYDMMYGGDGGYAVPSSRDAGTPPQSYGPPPSTPNAPYSYGAPQSYSAPQSYGPPPSSGTLPDAALRAPADTYSAPLYSETPTPTVTPTNTGAPTPTPTASYTPVVFIQQATEAEVQAPLPVAALPLPTPTLVLIAERASSTNCVELIENGGFEASGVGWNQAGSTILPVYETSASVGTSVSDVAIRLGLTGASTISGISATQQQVTLPQASNHITLRFRYFPLYELPPSRGDYQYVDIYHGESGRFFGRVLGGQHNDRAWIDVEYDLSALAGQSVRVAFMVSNDGEGGAIAMQIDDVSIQACRVPTSLPQNSFDAQANQPAMDNSAPQTFAAKNATLTGTEADVEVNNVSAYGFSFGRLGGLLAVLGIAGAALVLLPLARRYSQ